MLGKLSICYPCWKGSSTDMFWRFTVHPVRYLKGSFKKFNDSHKRKFVSVSLKHRWIILLFLCNCSFKNVLKDRFFFTLNKTANIMLAKCKVNLLFSTNIKFSTFTWFPFRGWRGGGSDKNDHWFPFLRIVELFERSLNVYDCVIRLHA